jgi:outer membrane protein assembly factor BamA
VLAGVTLALLAALAAAHAPPARAWARARAEAWLADVLDGRVRIDALDYNLITLKVRARGVRLAGPSAAAAPYFEADRVEVALPWRGLRRVRLDALALGHARLRVGELRAYLAGRPKSAGPGLQRLEIGHLAVERLDVLNGDSDWPVAVDLPHLSLDALLPAPGGASAKVRAQGRGRVVLAGTEVPVDAVNGTLGFDGQQVRLANLRLDGPDLGLWLSGVIRLLGPDSGYALDARIEAGAGWVARFAPELPSLDGRLAGTATVTGPLGAPRLAFAAHGPALTLDGVPAAVSLSGRWEDDQWSFDEARLETRGGTVALAGRLPSDSAPGDGTLTWSGLPVDVLARWAGWEVGRLAGVSAGTASIEGWAAGGRPAAGRLTGRVRPAPRRGVPVSGQFVLQLDGPAWSGRLEGGRLGTTDVTARVGGRLGPGEGRAIPGATLRGTARLVAADAADALVAARALGVPIADPVVAMASGRAVANLTLTGTLAAPVASGPLQVEDWAWLGEPVAAAGQVRVDRNRLDVENMEATQGPNALSGRVSLDVRRTRVSADFEADLPDLPEALARWTDEVHLTAGSAHVSGSLDGSAAAPDVDANITGADLTVAGQHVTRASATLRLRGDALEWPRVQLEEQGGTLFAAGRLDLAEGTFELESLTAHGYPVSPLVTETPAVSGTVAAVALPIAVRLDAQAEGRGRLDAPDGSATFAAHDLTWSGVALGTVEGTLAAEGGHVRWTASQAALSATATGSLSIGDGSPFSAVLALRDSDVAALAGIAGERAARLDASGSIDADVTIAGRLDALDEVTIEGSMSRASVVVRSLPLALQHPARLRMRGQEVVDLSATWRTGATTARLDRTPEAALVANVDGRLEDFAPWLPPLRGGRLTVRGAVRAALTLGSSLEAIAPTGTFLVTGAEATIPDLAPVTGIVLRGTLAGGRVSVERLGASWNGARLETSGSVPVSFAAPWLPDAVAARLAPAADAGPARAEMRLTGLSMAVARQFLGPDALPLLDGHVDAVLLAAADEPAFDAIVADGTVTDARLRVSDITFRQARAATIAVRNGAVTLSNFAWEGPNTNITLAGGVEFGRGAPVYDFAADGVVDLRVLGPVAGGRLGGTVRGEVAGRGQSGAVAWRGHLEVEDGAVLLRQQQVALLDARATLDLVEDRLRIVGFSARLNGGTVEGGGEVASTEAGLRGRLAVTLAGVGVELPEGTRHDLDGDLTLTLDERSVLGGRLAAQSTTIENSIVSLATLATSVQGGGLAEAAAAPSRLAAAIGLDIALVTADDLVFDSNDLRLSATADLRLVGTLARPGLRGRASLREEGEIFLAGRVWTVEDGTVDFVEGRGNAVDVRLTVTATARISQYDVEMRVNGTPEELNVSLSSDPPLGQTDLTSLVTTGGVASNDSTNRGTFQVAGAISAELLGSVGRAMGLDTIRIEQTEPDLSSTDLEPVARFTVSKRFGPHFEVVYSQSLAETDDLAWLLLYRPGWYDFEARATYRTRGAETLELRQELDFGARGGTLSRRPPRPAAPRVASVEVTGLPPADAEAVRRTLKTRPGNRFDARAWQRDEERVLRDFRSRDHLLVRARPTRTTAPDGRLALAMQVTPGPRTRIVVSGWAVSRETLDAMRATWSRVVLEDFLELELTRPLRLELAVKGHLQPEMRLGFRPLDDEGREAVVEVDPGPRSAVRAIVFQGNAQVPADTLEAALDARDLLDRVWVRPELAEPVLVSAYRAQGFLDAAVSVLPVRFDGERAELPVQVTEGLRYQVGEVAVAGASRLGEDRARAALALPPGTAYVPAAVPRALSRVRTAYIQAGFRAAEVEVTPSRAPERPGTIDLAVTIAEGRRSVLGEVAFDNRANASQGLVDAVTQLEPGGPLDAVALDRAQQRLYDTGIFRSVAVDVEPMAGPVGEGDDLVRAVVRLEERPRYRLRYGVQFGQGTIEDVAGSTRSAEPGVTLDLLRRNLFGRGVSAGAGGYLSQTQYRVRGTMAATTFFGRFATTTLTAERSDQDRTLASGISVLDRSSRLIGEQRWRRGRARALEFAYGIDIDNRSVGIGLEPAEDRFVLSARVAGLTGSIAFDTRDNLFNPRSGQFHSSRADGGPGNWVSDVAYARYQMQQYVYVPVGPIVLASGFRFGTLDVDDEEQVAGLLLRFKAGGGSSVRGYEQDSLSPRSFLGVPVGGNVLLVLNEEVRFPIYRWFGGAAFIDVGNTFEGFDTFAFSDLAVGLGVGLRLNTPIVVVRLDVGFPVPRPASEPLARWYFGIGHAF